MLLIFSLFRKHVPSFRQTQSPYGDWAQSYQLWRSVRTDMFLSTVIVFHAEQAHKKICSRSSIARNRRRMWGIGSRVGRRARFYTPQDPPQHMSMVCVVVGSVSQRTCKLGTHFCFSRKASLMERLWKCFVSSVAPAQISGTHWCVLMVGQATYNVASWILVAVFTEIWRKEDIDHSADFMSTVHVPKSARQVMSTFSRRFGFHIGDTWQSRTSFCGLCTSGHI